MHGIFQDSLQFKVLPIESIEFVSLEFAFFFLAFLPLYWAAAKSPRTQNLLLLAATFGWLALLNPAFAAVLGFYALFVALIGRQIQDARLAYPDDERAGRPWLVVGIAGSLVHLALYKYAECLRTLMPGGLQNGMVELLLPLGLSYYTFQSITYMVAVYRGRIQPWPWYEVPLFLGFFPTISSGPIWRADDSKSVAGRHPGADAQLHGEQAREMIRPALALILILWGVAKIWWLAGWLEENHVKPVFAEPADHDVFSVLVAVYGFTVQLYLNFSGHADVAIGLAMLLGFRLPPNFAAPFLAHNLRDFWNRWHISLSTWIRDYIYIPLGGSRCGFGRTQLNVTIAMTLSGVWHGAAWTFVLWGLIHGLGMAALNCGDRFFGGRDRLAALGRAGRRLGIVATLSFVAFSFLVFRCGTLGEVGEVLAALTVHAQWQIPAFADLLCACLLPIALFCLPLAPTLFDRFARTLERMPVGVWCLPLAAAVFFLLIVAPSGVPGFIYANF